MKIPLYEQLYRFVLGEIEAGHYASGARVPSEKDLAARFGVSRITSKRALEKLAQDGIVQRARGRGSFVAAGVGSTVAGVSVYGRLESAGEPGGRPPLVGLLIPDASDTFGSHLVRTIERQLRDRHIRTVLCRTEGQRDLEEKAIDDCLALHVEGMIILPVHGEYYNARLLRLVLDHYPIVLIDRYLRGIPATSVCTDNRKAAEELTNHLIGLGHRHFAFITPPPAGTSSIEDRLLGIMAALAEHGLQFNGEEDVIYARFTMPGALTPATQHVEADADALRMYALTHPHVTAYIACEQPMAVLAQRELTAIGRSIPGDCAIACFDSPNSPLDGAPITYIKQEEENMGCEAVGLLLAQVEGREAALHVATGHLLVRGDST